MLPVCPFRWRGNDREWVSSHHDMLNLSASSPLPELEVQFRFQPGQAVGEDLRPGRLPPQGLWPPPGNVDGADEKAKAAVAL